MSGRESVKLIECTDQDLVGVFRWFNSEKAVFYWAGPDITYPLQLKRFKTESKFANSYSYVLKKERQLLAFGQIYSRLGRCHLGRLVVSPKHRGAGVGKQLIDALLKQGQQLLGQSNASLFVLADNHAAMRLYQKLGFIQADYPKTIPLKNCLYMTRDEKPQ